MRGRNPRMFNFVSGIILSKLFHFVIFLSYFCSPVSHCFVMVYFIFVTVFFMANLADFHFLNL